MLALQLLTNHNVFHMNRLLAAIRLALKNGTLDLEEKNWVVQEMKDSNEIDPPA